MLSFMDIPIGVQFYKDGVVWTKRSKRNAYIDNDPMERWFSFSQRDIVYSLNEIPEEPIKPVETGNG